jgi:hypothetical protein
MKNTISSKLNFNSTVENLPISIDMELQKQETSENFDLLREMYDGGFHHLLQKVFLNMTKKSLRACRETDPAWKDIVTDLVDSGRRPTVRNVLDARIDQNFQQKKATIMSSKFEWNRTTVGGVYPAAMVADEKNIFIGGNDDDDVVIHVLNAETFNRIAILKVGRNVHTHTISIKRLDINEDYLVASLEIFGSHDPYQGHLTALIWKRDPEFIFKFHPHPIEVPSIKVQRRLAFSISTRFYGDVLDHIEKKEEDESALKATFTRWNLDANKKEGSNTLVAAVEKSHPEIEIIPLLAETADGDFLTWNTSPTEGVLKRHSGDQVLWARTFKPGQDRHPKFSFGLGRVFEDYAVLSLVSDERGGSVTLLEVVELATGKTVNVLDMRKELCKIIGYQICGGRIALQGWRDSTFMKNSVDIVIVDLKTSQVLVRMTDLGFKHCQGAFCLEKDRVTFYSDFQYRSARFWL